MYNSQVGQDAWVHSVLGDKKDGYFIELGAADGKEYSNSLFFEKILRWKGLCIEPNPNYYNDLQKSRNCTLSFDCISDEDDKIVEFNMCDLASGIQDTAGPFTKGNNIIYKKTKKLDTLLNELNAPFVIDYLSLDVEGHEFEVIKNFDFSKYRFNCITVEHNEPHIGPSMRNKLRIFLESKDYMFIKGNDDVLKWNHGPIDDFYVHSSLKDLIIRS
uniref:Methyltransferase FkbM domain-containing protein n=1 Tax=viral metagenome TaxID=1070528 RepID=A0A6C0D934_9ZZZZ